MDINEITNEITKLENGNTTYSAVEKLALLYTVRNNLNQKERRAVSEYSFAGSEFVSAVKGAPFEEVLAVLDEHFEAIKVIYPKEYSLVLKRIKALK